MLQFTFHANDDSMLRTSLRNLFQVHMSSASLFTRRDNWKNAKELCYNKQPYRVRPSYEASWKDKLECLNLGYRQGLIYLSYSIVELLNPQSQPPKLLGEGGLLLLINFNLNSTVYKVICKTTILTRCSAALLNLEVRRWVVNEKCKFKTFRTFSIFIYNINIDHVILSLSIFLIQWGHLTM